MGNNKPVTEQTAKEWDKHIKIDLSGVYYCCKSVGEVMIKQKMVK